jgi:hypothetical protein
VLGEQHVWLRRIAEGGLRDPVQFWKRMDALPTLKASAPISAIDAIEHLMPAPAIKYRLTHRVAGLGSLGHARYVALADWRGGRIAREAKALVPSSACWAESLKAEKDPGPPEILYQTIINHAVRCPDPFVQLRGRWIVRRLGPLCSRIELASLRGPDTELRLLHAMGWETANIHLGTPVARNAVTRHLKKQKGKWLHHAAETMLQAVREDWNVWKKKGYA